MGTLFTLWRRELASYFLSPVAYVVVIVFLLVTGFNFYLLMDLMSSQRVFIAEVMGEQFKTMLYLFLVVIPVLTMRVFAEEHRSGTIETLMTAPVTDTAVVLAKFLAALAFFTFMWLPTLSYGYILEQFSAETAPLDVGCVLGGYLGTLLIGMFYVSIGVFCSSLTRIQLVSAVASFAMICLLFYFGTVHASTNETWLREVSSYSSGLLHQLEFTRGMLDTRPVVFYLSGTLFMLFSTIRILEARRW
jgi:ABC-2 type transport system permease protein